MKTQKTYHIKLVSGKLLGDNLQIEKRIISRQSYSRKSLKTEIMKMNVFKTWKTYRKKGFYVSKEIINDRLN